MGRITADVEKDVAQLGHALVKTNLINFIRKPTPYYWTRTEVRGNPAGPGLSIWDSYIIYGPWLEGVGSRNFPKTRFKGYASFRIAAGVLQRRAAGTADVSIRKNIGRLN
jgi:hypothetical protein